MPASKMEHTKERMLQEFSDLLIAFVTDDSFKGTNRFLKAVENAGKIYRNEEGYRMMNSLYYWTRVRTKRSIQAEKEVNHAPEILLRLQALAKVFFEPSSHWKSTSYNTTLLIFFLGAIDDHPDPDCEPFYAQIAPELAERFKKQLQESLHAHVIQHQTKLEKERELAHINQNKRAQTLDSCHVFTDPDQARQFALKSPLKLSFGLHYATTGWSLKWYDLRGIDHELEINDALAGFLNQSSSPEVLVVHDGVINACLQARLAFMSHGAVLVNPSPDALSSITSTYVLRKTEAGFSLVWYDYEGESKSIGIEKSPQLYEYLHGLDSVESVDINRLQVMLSDIRKFLPIGIEKAKRTLEDFFQSEQLKKPRYDLVFSKEHDPQAKYESTFVLTLHHRPELTWYDRLGHRHEVPLAEHPKINAFVSEHMDSLPTQKERFITLLAELDLSPKPIGRESFKQSLEKCLSSGQKARQEKATPVNPLTDEHYQAVAKLFGGQPHSFFNLHSKQDGNLDESVQSLLDDSIIPIHR